VIPVIAYLSLNSSISIHIGFWGLSASQWTISLILLFVLEVLIFLPFIYREIAHSPEFYILFFTAAAALIFIMGDTSDFNSRIELPLNYYITFRLIVMVSKWRQLSLTTRRLFLGVAMLAAVTPILEISRTLYMTAREPAGEYISRREPSIFRFQLLRHNFVVDSLLINPTATIKIFNYNQDIKKPDHSKKE
ncbi:MAG: hypothetical protein K2K29_01290, partial [Muribaculaceae bacterium]|nr:hypothetical protein [Muribaculaceae bacterium]